MQARRADTIYRDATADFTGPERLTRNLVHAMQDEAILLVLDTLEKAKDFARLPAFFATGPGKTGGDAKELAYLNDALALSLDRLIRDAAPDARRLLWLIAVANEPVALGLLSSVWSGEGREQQQLRQIKRMLDRLPRLPPELHEKLKAMPAEVRALLDALPPEPSPRPEIQPLPLAPPFWLPRPGVGASPDAPASSQPTGRWSGQDGIPTRSVGTRRYRARQATAAGPAP